VIEAAFGSTPRPQQELLALPVRGDRCRI
jgi:hypothetical protein